MPRPGTSPPRLTPPNAPEHALVAFRGAREHDRGDLLRRVAGLAAWLEKSGPGRWLVQSEDAYASAICALALIHSRGCAVVAPNAQAETLRRLARGVEGALAPPGVAIPDFGARPRLWPLEDCAGSEALARVRSRAAVVAEFQTSGTTGPEKSVRKELRQIEDEVAALEELFGERLGAATSIFATVSPQHIYGLLFRVLWPLSSGRPFQAETLLLPPELVPRMRERSPCALVTTPSHLQRMASGRGLRALAGHCRAVFSSGAALDSATRDAVAEQLGTPPIEILGSTETGGIAWRTGDASWTAFPGVAIETDESGRLVAVSPFASGGERCAGGRRRVATGDLCLLGADGRFELRGRADRVVKIAGKRLALAAMESELLQHPWVLDAAIVAIERGAEARVAAAVALSAEGRAALAQRGRGPLREACAGHLAARFDRVLLPRAWRFLAALPRNATGKLPAAALRGLFERPREPIAHAERREPNALRRELEVPLDLAQLEGHFEGDPIVPGIAMLAWVMSAARELLGHDAPIGCIDVVKFPEPLRPGARFALRVEHRPERGRLDFELRDAARVFATGRCTLAPGGVA